MSYADPTRIATDLRARSALPVAPRLVTYAASSLADRPRKPREWFYPGVIPRGAVTLLGGDGGVGKSLLTLQLAASAASGERWAGQMLPQGGVLYLSAEDDTDELQRRLDSITAHAGTHFHNLNALEIADLTEGDPTLWSDGGQTTALFDELLAKATASKPTLIVLDSLADVFAANENDRAQVRGFMSALRRLAQRSGAAVILLGHPSLSGRNSGSGESGSTAWNNSSRSRLFFSKPDETADPSARVLTVKKANYGPAGTELRLRLTAGGFVSDGEHGRSLQSVDAARDEVDEQFVALLVRFAAQGRRVSSQPGPTYAPAMFAREDDARGTGKRAFEQAMSRLLRAGRLSIEETGPPSKRRSHIVITQDGAS